ncbi:MAG: PGF-pre-PGF domain-containing protein, partial [Candidatus Micrarchaeaceae archaeon]
MKGLLLRVLPASMLFLAIIILGIMPYMQRASSGLAAFNSNALPTNSSTSTVSTTSTSSITSTTSTTTSSTSTTIPANTVYYSLAFNSVPSAGTISFNGIGYQNGNAIQVAPGNYPINAIAPANFIFSSWASTNSVNLTFANPYSANTNLVVSGNGMITAEFNGITMFSENGLPANTQWNVIYDSIIQNAAAPNSIAFSTSPGNYTFTIENAIASNSIYLPTPQNGFAVAGNSTTVYFTPQKTNSSTSTSTSTTSTTTSTTTLNSSAISIAPSVILHSISSTLKSQLNLELNMQINHLFNNSQVRKKAVYRSIEAMNISIAKHAGNQVGANVLHSLGINSTFPNEIYTANIIVAYPATPISKSNMQVGVIQYSEVNISFINSFTNEGLNIKTVTSALPKGIRIPILVNDSGAPLNSVSAVLNSEVSNSTTSITVANAIENVVPPPEKAYKYFIINSSISDANIVAANYTFSVNSSWVNARGISPEQVALFKYVNNKWVPLPTTMIASNASSYTYIARSDSFSLYVVSFSVNSTAGYASPESVTLPTGYRLYLCAAGANWTFSTSGTAFTWVQDEGAPPGAPVNDGENASIGHQSGNVCSAYTTGARYPGLAVAGIGINASYYKFYGNSSSNSSSASLAYTVTSANSLVVIMGAAGYYEFSAAPTLPTGCALNTMVNNTDNFESAFVAVCPSASSGTYTVTESLSSTGSSALGAYVFPPQNVIFNDNIPNGKISTAGLTLSSGSKLQILGANTITALPPGNFVFNNWQVSNTVNLTLSNAIANPTTLTVFGNGVVTAIFNGITKFIETGLPTGTKWNVTYDSILNSSTTNTIVFSTSPGNYLFTVANQVVSGTTYVPSPSSGYLVAGNTTSITFSPVTFVCTISLTPNAI